MKPFEELTYRGKARRLRQLAALALDDYGIREPRLEFVHTAGNTMFRVSGSIPRLGVPKPDRYGSGQYLLRIHSPGYQTTEAIELELAWLSAMCREENLPVPDPVPTVDGRLVTQVSIPGVPEKRDCSLLRWVKGRFITKRIQPQHLRAQGELMARLHDFSARWQCPENSQKRRYDWDHLFGNVKNDTGTEIPVREVWPLLPPQRREPLQMVTRRVGEVMEKWGTGPDVHGLIHADLGVDANVLFWRGEARAIDFDDSGFGYWIYDLAVSLEHCRDDPEYPAFRDALLSGYAGVRSLREEQLEQLDLFMAGFYVYMSLGNDTSLSEASRGAPGTYGAG
jgi:Ser/Thr protein kinase RdoA (MazF antagonist)